MYTLQLYIVTHKKFRPDSSVGIANDYGLEGPGIESPWGEIFCTCSYRYWSTPSLLYNGYWVFPRAKCGRGVTLTPHPLLVQLVMKE